MWPAAWFGWSNLETRVYPHAAHEIADYDMGNLVPELGDDIGQFLNVAL